MSSVSSGTFLTEIELLHSLRPSHSLQTSGQLAVTAGCAAPYAINLDFFAQRAKQLLQPKPAKDPAIVARMSFHFRKKKKV